MKSTYDLLKNCNDAKVLSFLTSIQHRIATVEDYQLIGTESIRDLKYLYTNPIKNNHKDMVRSKAFDHTMFDSIDEYCIQKFPETAIRKCLLENYTFEVHGILPQHFEELQTFLNFTEVTKIYFQNNPTSKRFNFLRPSFYKCINNKGEKIFVVAVGCGHDYTMHYASMLQHVLDIFTVSIKVKIIRYPLAESALPIWTGLDSKIIKKDETIILGYIDEIEKEIKKKRFLEQISLHENDYYISIRYKNIKTNSIINLLGVKFSFWGDISAKITTRLCRLGAPEIIYIGKLGTLGTPDDIYKKIFAPSKFLILYHDKVVGKILNLPNKFLESHKTLDTGYHVSVPTVIEEDYVQRQITNKLSINSIDNEISQIAFSIKHFNESQAKKVSFTSLHFATDYVRLPNERAIKTDFDLSNNRTKEAIKNKKRILKDIVKILISYLETI